MSDERLPSLDIASVHSEKNQRRQTRCHL